MTGHPESDIRSDRWRRFRGISMRIDELAGIDASAIRHDLAGGAERVRRFVVGQSTGTSGKQGC